MTIVSLFIVFVRVDHCTNAREVEAAFSFSLVAVLALRTSLYSFMGNSDSDDERAIATVNNFPYSFFLVSAIDKKSLQGNSLKKSPPLTFF